MCGIAQGERFGKSGTVIMSKWDSIQIFFVFVQKFTPVHPPHIGMPERILAGRGSTQVCILFWILYRLLLFINLIKLFNNLSLLLFYFLAPSRCFLPGKIFLRNHIHLFCCATFHQNILITIIFVKFFHKIESSMEPFFSSYSDGSCELFCPYAIWISLV